MSNSKNRPHYTPYYGDERLGAVTRANAYMASEDFGAGAEPILTIDSIGYGDCQVGKSSATEVRDIICFREHSAPGLPVVRPMVCNATNRKVLLALYGDLTPDVLIGKRIRLYVDPRVKAIGGGTTSGIRIRKMIPEPAPAQQMPPQPIPGNPVPPAICTQCGRPVTAVSNGSYEEVLQYGLRCWGRELCADCQSVLMQAGQAQN